MQQRLDGHRSPMESIITVGVIGNFERSDANPTYVYTGIFERGFFLAFRCAGCFRWLSAVARKTLWPSSRATTATKTYSMETYPFRLPLSCTIRIRGPVPAVYCRGASAGHNSSVHWTEIKHNVELHENNDALRIVLFVCNHIQPHGERAAAEEWRRRNCNNVFSWSPTGAADTTHIAQAVRIKVSSGTNIVCIVLPLLAGTYYALRPMITLE